MNDRESPERLGLLDLVEVGRWQRLQDHFADVVGIALRTVSPTHALVVNPSWPMGLRSDRTIEALQIGDELEGLLPQHNLPCAITSLTAPLGVSYAAVPIRVVADRPLAYFVLGPMVVGRREDELHFQQRAGEMGLDGRMLWTLLQSLKIYTFAGMHSVLNLMAEVSDALVQVAYQAKQLQTIFPTTGKVDQAVVTFYTNRVFTSLLEAATLATKADGGSVMVHDRSAGVFRISVSQGLSDEVVRNAAVRPGEGIAGLAAQQRQILIIDDRVDDQRLRARMQRKNLVSSLVAPVGPESASEPIGILNLRTTQPDGRFTNEHVHVLRNLLDLAGMALTNLQGVFNQARSPSTT